MYSSQADLAAAQKAAEAAATERAAAEAKAKENMKVCPLLA